MRITIKLFAGFRTYLQNGQKGVCTLRIEDGKTITAALEYLNIPADIPKIIIVNGILKRGDTPLNDGDTISVFPSIAGG